MLSEIAARLSESLEDDDAAMLRVVLAIFCKVHPDELKAPLSALAHRWYEIAGPHLEWQAIGANASRLSRAHSDTLSRIEQEIDVARGDQMMSFLLQGAEAFAPEFRLKSLVTDHVDNPDQKWTTLTEIVLPIPSDDANWEALVQLADDICGRFPYDSAYMSPAFLCGDESLEHEAGIAIAPLAMRHHGLDVADNATTCYFLGRMTRGARWLTFLSDDLAGKVDLSPLRQNGMSMITRTTNGVRILASAHPEIGDTNRQVPTPGLRDVARAIEEITFFGDQNLAGLLGEDQNIRAQWERRFFSD